MLAASVGSGALMMIKKQAVINQCLVSLRETHKRGDSKYCHVSSTRTVPLKRDNPAGNARCVQAKVSVKNQTRNFYALHQSLALFQAQIHNLEHP